MKTRIIYIVFAIIIFGVLGVYVSSNTGNHEIAIEETEYPNLPANELFVPIHADSLDFYIKQYYNRSNLKTNNQRSLYTIEYNPNAYILLHSNNNKMREAKKTLETADIDGFSVKYSGNIVRITMRKDGDYVDCPALIVAEILRKMNE